MLALIGGTSLLYSPLPNLALRTVATPYGPAEVLAGEIVILQRHQHHRPPHRINHRAHLAALAITGVDKIVSIGSAGSLRREIPTGSLLIPGDYSSLHDIPTFHDNALVHVHPELSRDLTSRLAVAIPEAHLGGTYVQTRGPRIETVAEVRALARNADVVGMTVASEATLACELGIPFAALCTIDNCANGLGGEALTYEHILRTAREHRDRTGEIVARIIKELAS